MPGYSYIIIDQNGKEKKGAMEAVNVENVAVTLRSEGYIPISIEPQNILNKDINITLGNSVKPRDLCVFCRQFESILSAGVSMIQALSMLSDQTSNKILGESIKEVQTSVEKGETLSDAMRAEGKVFPSILIRMVEAGEISGNLEIAFERMALHFEKDSKLKAQVKKAMIYPVIVGIVAVCVLLLMMIVVIPNFVGMFQEMDMKLPYMTQLVVNMSIFVKTRWYILVGIITVSVILFHIYKQTPDGKRKIGRLQLKLPLIGKLTVKSLTSRYARTLSTLLAAGLPMIQSIEITAGTMDNSIVKQALLDSKEEVAKGIPLSNTIKASGIFPPIVSHMTKIGEETGNMETMLNKLADYYDEEVEIAAESLTAAMEPFIIIILALIVGFLIMAIMQPIMSMYNGLGNL